MVNSNAESAPTKPSLLILKHFYKLKAAEHEVVERLVAATIELGWIPRVIEVDVDFKYLNMKKYEENIDAVLDIHYEYPKFFKARSIGAFWTPTSFMKDWDLAYVWENQLSHDLLVHTGSNKILDLLTKFRPDDEFGLLNHTLPGSWISWINESKRNEKPRAFYAGINWNKLSGRPGRHHELFKLLDISDVLDIYGPRKISHIVPWRGFESYRGEVAFDGKSILKKSHESGISLVLSSEQHLEEEIISSRFFEGLAAGNVIISDGHPFIRKHLGKNGRYLSLDRGDRYTAEQLIEYVDELRGNPRLLKEEQDNSQNLFLEKFDLTQQLSKILIQKDAKVQYPNIDALVLGNSSSHLCEELRKIGFKRVEHSEIAILDLQDLLSLAQSLELREFCVFYSETEILDGFGVHLNSLLTQMKGKNVQFGSVISVVLSQGYKGFAPVLLGKTTTVPLNGLVVDLNNEVQAFAEIPSKIPYLRVQHLAEMKFISTLFDTYSFLFDVGKDYGIGKELSMRKLIQTSLEKRHMQEFFDVVEEIRMQPRGRRRVLSFSLFAALPFSRPFVAVAKWLLRTKS